MDDIEPGRVVDETLMRLAIGTLDHLWIGLNLDRLVRLVEPIVLPLLEIKSVRRADWPPNKAAASMKVQQALRISMISPAIPVLQTGAEQVSGQRETPPPRDHRLLFA